MKSLILIVCLFLLGGVFAFVVYGATNQLSRNDGGVSNNDVPLKQDTQRTKFSLEQPPEQSLQGIVLKKSGDIWWQSRTATESSVMPNLNYVQQGEVIKTGEHSSLSLTFDRNNTINISSLSEVNVIQTLPYNLVFQQSKGMIEYQTEGLSPISIRTFRLITKVEKGQVLVSVDEEHNTTVKVLSGNATVAYNSQDFVSQVSSLNIGETFFFNNDNREGNLE